MKRVGEKKGDHEDEKDGERWRKIERERERERGRGEEGVAKTIRRERRK